MSEEDKAYSDKLFAEGRLYAHTEAARVKEEAIASRGDRDYADKILVEAKLYASAEAQKAERSALAILGSIGLVLGIVAALGLKIVIGTQIKKAADDAGAKAASAAVKKAKDATVKDLLAAITTDRNESLALRLAIEENHRISVATKSELVSMRDQGNQLLENLRELVKGRSGGSQDTGFYVVIGDRMIQFGSQLTRARPDKRVRDFAITFKPEFLSKPIVTATFIDSKSSGDAFITYSNTTSARFYSGSAIDIEEHQYEGDVVINYIAIGDAPKVK